MFVYVVFPDELPSAAYPYPDWADSVTIGFDQYFFNQSNGRLNFESFIYHNPTRADGLWIADRPASNYASEGTVVAHPEWNLSQHWCKPALLPGRYWYGALQAEILLKIEAARASAQLPNPFANVSAVIFVYHSDLIGGGYGRNSVDPTTFNFLTGVMNTELFGFWECRLPGVQLDEALTDAGREWIGDHRWVIAHEMGHYFGFNHTYTTSRAGASDVPEAYLLNPESYFYGPYSNMSLVRPAGIGPMPFIERDLIERGWLEWETVEADTIGIRLDDVRLGRKVLKLVVPNSTVTDLIGITKRQAMYLSYHGGNGIETFAKQDGSSVYPARGLAVWNSLFEATYPGYSWFDSGIWDLESAWGRYSDPDTSQIGEVWRVEDPNGGYDNLDVWVDLTDEDHDPPNDFSALYDRFYNYPGSRRDFFGEMSGKHEFSYRTNPNTNSGLSSETLRVWRRDAQETVNSLIIRVVEEFPGHVVLDILFAPREEIASPNGGEILQVGQSHTINWDKEYTMDQPGGIINTVDIYCSRGAGYDDQLIASGVDATFGSYQWTPAAAHVGKACKIRIVYHNVNDAAHVGEDESDAVFTIVDLPAAKFTDVSSQTGLVPPGVPYSAAPGDFQPDGMNDLLITATGGFVSMGHVYLIQPSGAPLFGNATVSNIVDGRGIAVADFDNDGDHDFFLAHETTPKLYRNQSGTFFDVTASIGLASLAAPSTAACWGDYDRDGWLDLYVVRSRLGYSEPPDYLNIAGEGHRLFRNLGATNGGFVDVTAAAGISGLAGNGSVSASWGDIENDGDLDLIVTNLQEPPTGPGGIGNHLFVNQGIGTFVEEFLDRFPGEFYYCTAAQWADLNNDGFLDLAVSCAQPGSAIYFNDGSGHFPDAGRVRFDASGNGYNGVQAFDHDLDGWNDVLWVSRSASEPSQFFSGVPTATGVGFVNNTANVGLSGSSKAVGAVAADYTRDGDLDLFVGRSSSSGQYFYKTDSRSGANSLGRNYVKVRLDSPLKANNRQGIGGAVTVTAGDLVQTRVVDGGSGRGGQQDRDLIFGLGDYSGTVTATVKWPRGHVQSGIPLFVSSPASVDSVNTVVDETMVISNLNAASLIVPGTTLFDWVFSWDTNVACDSSLDVLTFDQVGIQNPCWPGWTTLTPSTPGVVYTYEPKPDGGYLHKFTIYGQDCNLGCSFRYSAFSAMGANQAISATKTKQIKFCPSGF